MLVGEQRLGGLEMIDLFFVSMTGSITAAGEFRARVVTSSSTSSSFALRLGDDNGGCSSVGTGELPVADCVPEVARLVVGKTAALFSSI